MKLYSKFFGTILMISILYLCFYPINLDPIARDAPPYPGTVGDFEINNLLTQIEFLEVNGIGPEAIANDSLGNFYTGIENGNILKINPDLSKQSIIANTGGRPLGMKIAPKGNLIITDQFKGLISLDSLGNITTLINEIDGTPILFADDLAITKEGVVYFSDATQRNPIEIENEFWEQQPSGRIISFDLNSGESEVVLNDLFFANGVALDSEEEFLIVTETFGAQIIKHWIKGGKSGTTEIFNNTIPGYPDNVTFSNDTFWVAIPSQRAVEVEPLTSYPFIRSILLRLPRFLLDKAVPKPYSMVLGFDINGNIKHNLQDPDGGFHYITSVLQIGDKLYLGSLKEPGIGIFNLK